MFHGPTTTLPPTLDRILRATSRSIYLTLRVVPLGVRRQLMLGYLFCRAADTIADTRVLPRERRIEMLALYRSLFEMERPEGSSIAAIAELAESGPGEGFSPEEAELLRELAACFEVYSGLGGDDRGLMRRLLTTLTLGMQMDLEVFPSEESGELVALDDDAALDRYCYHVAGCVGEFWTDLQATHIDALRGLDRATMRDLGVRFGKGLQMTNILRDMPDDLRIGRCYVPRSRLEPRGVSPEDLRAAVIAGAGGREPSAALVDAMRPVLDSLLDLTLEHFRSGWRYTLALPRRIPRLRLACALPLVIGLGTVRELRSGYPSLLAGRRIKVRRSEVSRLLTSSTGRVMSNSLMTRLYDRLERDARRTEGRTG